MKMLEKGGAKLSEHRLRNGLRVLIAERHSDPVVSVITWYKVGARNEREDEAGLSHFLEHMMFKGSKRFGKGEVDQITTELGGSNNAYTSYDHTAYWFELASDRWEKALEIEARPERTNRPGQRPGKGPARKSSRHTEGNKRDQGSRGRAAPKDRRPAPRGKKSSGGRAR